MWDWDVDETENAVLDADESVSGDEDEPSKESADAVCDGDNGHNVRPPVAPADLLFTALLGELSSPRPMTADAVGGEDVADNRDSDRKLSGYVDGNDPTTTGTVFINAGAGGNSYKDGRSKDASA
jgi:hypothetical protein